MGLVDLNNITLNKTVIGIACPACGGDLQHVADAARLTLWQRLLSQTPMVTPYFCKSCGKEYQLIEKSH